MPISFDGKKGEFSECVTHFMSKNNTRTDKNFSKEEIAELVAHGMLHLQGFHHAGD